MGSEMDLESALIFSTHHYPVEPDSWHVPALTPEEDFS
jgi:hypothetical protein